MARKKIETPQEDNPRFMMGTEEWLAPEGQSVFENTVSPEEKVEDNTTIHETKDPLADKVHSLRAKGFDNNRIAAMLMTPRTIIDKI